MPSVVLSGGGNSHYQTLMFRGGDQGFQTSGNTQSAPHNKEWSRVPLLNVLLPINKDEKKKTVKLSDLESNSILYVSMVSKNTFQECNLSENQGI